MDHLDKRLLYELDYDARESLASIARKLKVSSDALEKRLDKLENSGLVKHYSVQINQRSLGNIVFKVFLKLVGSKSSRETVVRAVSKLSSLVWLVEAHGQWDLCFCVAATSPNQFSEQLRKLLSRHSVFISDQLVLTTTEVIRYPRNYLLEKPSAKSYAHIKPVQHFSLNSFDKRLLKALEFNGRATFVDLAQTLGTSPAKIRYCLSKLIRLGVISGFRPRLDTRKIGLSLYKILLERLDYSIEIESQVKNFCRKNCNITYLAQQLGRFSLEFDVEVQDLQELNNLIDKFREEFDGSFRGMECLFIKGNFEHRIALD